MKRTIPKGKGEISFSLSDLLNEFRIKKEIEGKILVLFMKIIKEENHKFRIEL